MADKLPTILFTQVVRASQKGSIHGKIFLLDLETEKFEEVIDWDDPKINWEGRGGDRGLRGIAFYDDKVFIAASSRIIIYDRNFNELSSIKNPYLGSVHEIFIDKDLLYIASTEFNSIVIYDLKKETFVKSYCFTKKPKTWMDRFYRTLLGRRFYKKSLFSEKKYKFYEYDPLGDDGPIQKDRTHINNVWLKDGCIYFSGTMLSRLYRIKDGHCDVYATVPKGTHNAMPYKGGVLYCDTPRDNVGYGSIDGSVIEQFNVPTFEDNTPQVDGSGEQIARAGFARGLEVWGDYLFVGVAPASIYVYKFGNPNPIKTIRVSENIRYAVHGLEVWK